LKGIAADNGAKAATFTVGGRLVENGLVVTRLAPPEKNNVLVVKHTQHNRALCRPFSYVKSGKSGEHHDDHFAHAGQFSMIEHPGQVCQDAGIFTPESIQNFCDAIGHLFSSPLSFAPPNFG
jgi:hypothetical protein